MNCNSIVPQWLRHTEIKRRLTKGGAPQSFLAYFGEVSEGRLSVVLSGRAGLSEKAQDKISRALDFLEWMNARAGKLPIDYRDLAALEPFFKEFKKLSAASEVVGTDAE